MLDYMHNSILTRTDHKAPRRARRRLPGRFNLGWN